MGMSAGAQSKAVRSSMADQIQLSLQEIPTLMAGFYFLNAGHIRLYPDPE